MKKTLAEILQTMKLRFTSGNSIAVERAHISAEEWAVVEDALFTQHAQIKALTEELESLDNCGMHPLC
jgi:hypothetical protein